MSTPQTDADARLRALLKSGWALKKAAAVAYTAALAGQPRCHFGMLERIYGIIHTHGQDGAVAVSALAAQSGQAPSAVSRMLRTLEAEGAVRRFADPRDRRCTLVALTPEGEAVRVRCENALRDFMCRAVGQMDAAQLSALADGALALSRALEAEAGAGAQPPSKTNKKEAKTSC